MGTKDRKWTSWVAGGVETKPKRKDTDRLVKAGELLGDFYAFSHKNRIVPTGALVPWDDQ